MFTIFIHRILALLGIMPYRHTVIAKLMCNGFTQPEAYRIYNNSFAPASNIAFMRLYRDVIKHHITSHTMQGINMLLHAYDVEALASLEWHANNWANYTDPVVRYWNILANS